jgi:hypothetical protein
MPLPQVIRALMPSQSLHLHGLIVTLYGGNYIKPVSKYHPLGIRVLTYYLETHKYSVYSILSPKINVAGYTKKAGSNTSKVPLARGKMDRRELKRDLLSPGIWRSRGKVPKVKHQLQHVGSPRLLCWTL